MFVIKTYYSTHYNQSRKFCDICYYTAIKYFNSLLLNIRLFFFIFLISTIARFLSLFLLFILRSLQVIFLLLFYFFITLFLFLFSLYPYFYFITVGYHNSIVDVLYTYFFLTLVYTYQSCKISNLYI